MKTIGRLVEALDEAGAPLVMIAKALNGDYDDFESDSATPLSDLIRDCTIFNLDDLKMRAMNGEFDGTPEEAQAWMKKEGKDLLFKEKS